MPVRFAALLFLSFSFTVSGALAQNFYSGNAWDRTLEASLLPAGSGTFDRLELGQFVRDGEPDLLILRGDQLLIAPDAASLAWYELLVDGVLDFAVLHGETQDRFVVATAGGVDLYTPDSKAEYIVTPIHGSGPTRLREVQLGSSAGIVAWGASSLVVFDDTGAAVMGMDAPGAIVDAVAGDFLLGESWDLAVLTKTMLFLYEGESGASGLELTAVATDGTLALAPGSASGLDLLVWHDGSALHNFNEAWIPYSFDTSGTDIRAIHAVDYHPDQDDLTDLVVVDVNGRQAMTLIRNDPATALSTGWEFALPSDPEVTFWIPLDGEPAGTALPSVMGDLDLDGDADLIAIGGSQGAELLVRPGELIDAEAQRIKLVSPYLEEEVEAISNLLLDFLALDEGPTGPVFPATATHVEVAVWESPSDLPAGPDPLIVMRQPIGSAPGQIPNAVTGYHYNFPFTPAEFSYGNTYFVRLRAVRETGTGDELFPSRIDHFSFDNPVTWTPPSGWQTYPYVPRYMTDPEGTGGLRGGGGGPIPPGN